MNEENWYQQYDEEPGSSPGPQGRGPQQGMSTGMKVFVGIAIFAGVMVLLCCGGIFWFGSRVASMMTEDPAEIRAIQEDIAGITVPEQVEPQAGINFGMFGIQMKMVVYEGGDSSLVLMEMAVPGQMSDVEMRQQFEQGMQQQGQDSDLDIESREERTLTVGGEEVTFEFVEGTGPDGGAYHGVSGLFSGRGGTAFLMYQVPEDQWNEEQVIEMIESIEN